MIGRLFVALIVSYSIFSCNSQTVTTVNVKFLDLIQTVEAPAGVDTRLVRRFTEEIKRIERVSQRLIRDLKQYQENYNLPQTALTERAIRQWYRLARRALLIETWIMRLYRDQAEYRVLTFNNKQSFVTFIREMLHASRRLLNDILLAVQYKI